MGERVNLDWVTHPLWLVINALAAYRLTRLWVADMLPPLPRMRDAVQLWAERHWQTQVNDARAGDDLDPDHLAEVDVAGKRALAGGYNAIRIVGPRESEVYRVHRIYGGTQALAYLVTCAFCSGYWISLAVLLAASLIPAAAWSFLAVPLAFSAVVGFLHQATE